MTGIELINTSSLSLSSRNLSEAENSTRLSRLMVIWLAGTVILLPVKFLPFPFNIEIVDVWILGGMPFVLLFLILRRPQFISFSYTIPIWLILVGSIISTFGSLSPTKSLIVIGKEVYLFVWFGIVIMLLFQLNAKEIRWVLRIWSVVAVCHGILMIAQFLSPKIFHFTMSLGGKTVTYENYRAVGLFVTNKAGNANKAAYFQILGFVPLLLSGFSKKTTITMSLILFASIISSGSNGATIAFSTGLTIGIVAIAIVKKSFSILIKTFLGITVAVLLIGSVIAILGMSNTGYLDHLESMGVGRFEKSADGRLGLWQRGLSVLIDYNIYFWGVGLENFRLVDPGQTDNQLHNDIMAFLVERGLIALSGLGLIAVIAARKAVHLVELLGKDQKRVQIGVVVFLSAIIASLIVSLFHQIFHARELWLMLALEEAILYKLVMSDNGIEPVNQLINVETNKSHYFGSHSESGVRMNKSFLREVKR